MKKLIFIDNDIERLALEDVDYVKDRLELWGGLNDEEINTIQVIPDFSRMDKDKMTKMLFDKNNCICTWSMYTSNHYSSLYQMLNFLASAGRNEVTDIVYFDGSGKIAKALEGEIRNEKVKVLAILNAIETNYIITTAEEHDKLVRLRVKLGGFYKDPFYFEEVDFKQLINN